MHSTRPSQGSYTLTQTTQPLVLRLKGGPISHTDDLPHTEEKTKEVADAEAKCSLIVDNLFNNHCEQDFKARINELRKVRLYLKAIKCLLDIKKTFFPDDQEKTGQQWNDPLSQRLLLWINHVSDFVKSILIPSSKSFDGKLNNALEKMEARIEKLANKILLNPMNETILDDPFIEKGYCLWGEKTLKCMPIL